MLVQCSFKDGGKLYTYNAPDEVKVGDQLDAGGRYVTVEVLGSDYIGSVVTASLPESIEE